MSAKSLDDVARYLGELLDIASFQHPEADEVDGLQVTVGGPVTRLAFAVNTSFMSIEGAAAAGAQLLLVHHGIWESVDHHLADQKRSVLRDRGVSLFQAHGSLDCHRELGTGVTLADMLGLVEREPFFEYFGGMAGVHGHASGSFEAFVERATRSLGVPVASWKNTSQFGHVGIITGGAGLTAHVEQARALGCDTYLTGEGNMYTQLYAREAKINLLLGTHYATEAPAVRAFGARVSSDLGLPWKFINEHDDVR